jgi:hypothetical protein
MNEINVQRCSICVQSKMQCTAFKSRLKHRGDAPGQIIHSDVGSYEEVSREGYKYYVTFVDDHLKLVSIFPMKSKSQVFSCFKLFRSSFEKDKKSSISSLRTDNGGEYMSNVFATFLSEAGISHEPGTPHSPELNGVAERMNRTISNLICCSLLGANLPKSFWAAALRHVLFTLNVVPCKTPAGFCSPKSVLGKTPLNLKYLHPFGCMTWYKVPEANRKKLDVKGRAAILLLYLQDGNGYRVWDLERRVVVKSRDVIFEDDKFPYGTALRTPPAPVMVELPWPTVVVPSVSMI